jgi:hypothetical protein
LFFCAKGSRSFLISGQSDNILLTDSIPKVSSLPIKYLIEFERPKGVVSKGAILQILLEHFAVDYGDLSVV